MKKSARLKIALGITTILFFTGLVLYPIFYKNEIKNYTINYVNDLGYPIQSIKCINVSHSYFAKILGYNEWRISVEFEKVQNVLFWFTYKKGKIIYQGVSSEPMMDKEGIIIYSDKFKKGLLLE